MAVARRGAAGSSDRPTIVIIVPERAAPTERPREWRRTLSQACSARGGSLYAPPRTPCVPFLDSFPASWRRVAECPARTPVKLMRRTCRAFIPAAEVQYRRTWRTIARERRLQAGSQLGRRRWRWGAAEEEVASLFRGKVCRCAAYGARRGAALLHIIGHFNEEGPRWHALAPAPQRGSTPPYPSPTPTLRARAAAVPKNSHTTYRLVPSVSRRWLPG